MMQHCIILHNKSREGQDKKYSRIGNESSLRIDLSGLTFSFQDLDCIPYTAIN